MRNKKCCWGAVIAALLALLGAAAAVMVLLRRHTPPAPRSWRTGIWWNIWTPRTASKPRSKSVIRKKIRGRERKLLTPERSYGIVVWHPRGATGAE